MGIKITVDISEELHQQAKIVMALRGESISDVVHAALVSYLEETLPAIQSEVPAETQPTRHSLLSLAGRYASGSQDTAQRSEEILAAEVDRISGFSAN